MAHGHGQYATGWPDASQPRARRVERAWRTMSISFHTMDAIYNCALPTGRAIITIPGGEQKSARRARPGEHLNEHCCQRANKRTNRWSLAKVESHASVTYSRHYVYERTGAAHCIVGTEDVLIISKCGRASHKLSKSKETSHATTKLFATRKEDDPMLDSCLIIKRQVC